MSNIWKFVILIVVSYFFGNITFARLVARTRNNDDITTHGSGNPGTTNMLRTHGLTLAIITLILDALKSVICCVIAYYWLKPQGGYLANLAVYVSGISCILGHIYPVIFKFKGGKGVATGFGVICVARPTLIPLFVVAYLTIFLIWRVGSLASLLSVILFMIGESIILLINGYFGSYVLLIFAVSLIVYAHRTNIAKLFANKESKIDINEAVQKDIDYAKEQREKRMKKKEGKNKSNDVDNKESEAVILTNESGEDVDKKEEIPVEENNNE